MSEGKRKKLIDTILHVMARCNCGVEFIANAETLRETVAAANEVLGGDLLGELGSAVGNDADARTILSAGMLTGSTLSQVGIHIWQNPTHRAEVFVK